ncbi:MAG: hypothetical protein ACXWH0_06100 [Acidimicrobiia bacterium]
MEAVIVPVIFGIIVLIAVAASAGSRRYESQWRAAAEHLQLGYQAGRMFSRPKLSGVVSGLTVKIDVSSSSGGSSNSIRTRYRIGYPRLGLDLHMSRRTGIARAAAMFGMNETKIGDAEFDDAFSIRTSDPQRFAARLPPPARRLLLDLVRDYRSVKITDEQLRYEKNGIERDTGTLVTTAQRLMEAALALQGASVGPAYPTTTPRLPIRPPVPPPPPISRPDPYDVGPIIDPVSLPAPMRARPVPAEPKPVSARPKASEVTADQIGVALFAKRRLSFQIAKQYEEQYQGRMVVWPGEVRTIMSGIGPDDPTRVTVLVATIRNELFGSVAVQAVASITGRVPPGLAAGKQVSVQGTLAGVDAMSRILFVEDARLEEIR